MRNTYVILLLWCITNIAYTQTISPYQKGLSSAENLKAIAGLAPYSTGGVGFDNRYEGVRGSSRLFDTLQPSFLKVKGQNYYLQLKTDIDLVRNDLIFIHPKNGNLLELPAGMVMEVIFTKSGKELIFRTTENKKFEKGMQEIRFFEVLSEGPYQLIKMPLKILHEANYKGAYSPDKRYDEFEMNYRYYISTPDSIFHQVQPTKKSLVKMFPEKKDLINKSPGEGSFADREEMLITIVKKF